MDDILKVIILSLIEGITEFLPVSSTGHLIVGTALLNFDRLDALFEIFIQVGAVVALMVYYRQTLRAHAQQLRADPRIRRFWMLIALAAAPAALVGFLFDEQIETLLFSPPVVALALIAGGVAFLLVERLPAFRTDNSTARHTDSAALTKITLRQAAAVGAVQTLALIPGMSRSGTSIVAGMLAGMDRRLATEFSFFLAMPLLGGATIYKLLTSLDGLQAEEAALLGLGALLSGLFAWFAIDWLLRFVSHSSFVAFGWYRIAAGLLILGLAANGLL